MRRWTLEHLLDMGRNLGLTYEGEAEIIQLFQDIDDRRLEGT